MNFLRYCMILGILVLSTGMVFSQNADFNRIPNLENQMIDAAIIKGMDTNTIVSKYNTSSAYVYNRRYKLKDKGKV